MQKNVAHNQEEKHPTEAEAEKKEMMELTSKILNVYSGAISKWKKMIKVKNKLKTKTHCRVEM